VAKQKQGWLLHVAPHVFRTLKLAATISNL